MRFLFPFILLLCLALTGCRFAAIPTAHGTALVCSALTDPHLARVEIRPDGTVVLEGYASAVNSEATKSIVAGAVEGVLRGVKP